MAAAAIVVLAIWLLVRLTAPASLAGTAAPGTGQARTVQVQRGDISEVIVIPGTVVANPQFTLLAATSGRVSHADGLGPGSPLSPGQQLGRVGSQAVTMPVGGMFGRWLIPEGAAVAAGVPVAEVAYAGFGHQASLPPQDAYRVLTGSVTGRADISGGPGPFDCQVLQLPLGDPKSSSEGLPVVCAIPLEIRAFAGLTGMVSVSSRQVHDVLTLPVTAVSGTTQTGEVSTVDGHGRVTRTKVTLGVTDGNLVEIVDGLSEGSVVLATAPELDAAP